MSASTNSIATTTSQLTWGKEINEILEEVMEDPDIYTDRNTFDAVDIEALKGRIGEIKGSKKQQSPKKNN